MKLSLNYRLAPGRSSPGHALVVMFPCAGGAAGFDSDGVETRPEAGIEKLEDARSIQEVAK